MLGLLKPWIVRIHKKKLGYLMAKVAPNMKGIQRVLDLGCGSGEVSRALLDAGYSVTSVDVVDKVKIGGVKVVVYDGKNLNYPDKSFDLVLLITVLHHVGDFRRVLVEAKRVGKKVLVVEDVFDDWWSKFWTMFWDSALNLEFFGHPHNNRNDTQWKTEFENLGFEILKEDSGKIKEIFYEFKQKIYLLK